MAFFEPEKIKLHLTGFAVSRLDIRTAEITGSTNDDIKALAESGAPEGTVMIAGEQTAGKGRLGRSFYSPKDTGLYMSVLLRPRLPASDALAITTAAAAAVALAADALCGTSAGIKWVNDIYVGGRKVCGILTESSLAPDGSMKYAVLGIGVNVADGGFPDDIADKAGALGADTALRPALAASILENFFAYYDKLPERGFMDEYRRRSVLTDRVIEYERGGERLTGTVLGIDDEARLAVRGADGIIRYLSSGEVNIITHV
ncbi:MAG: biotin--[acetyl-CoA-carboxylase] ligase [Ruminiclostridium sp.]|nr:biotin--[acetyl-CoA-carboxylase] ligase [Ruminiclostridium sp.]